MSKKLFVGNIDWNISEDELREAFAVHGDIEECIIIKDKMTNRSKGFGFVTFTTDSDADKAIAALDGAEINSRKIAVNEARPPKKY